MDMFHNDSNLSLPFPYHPFLPFALHRHSNLSSPSPLDLPPSILIVSNPLHRCSPPPLRTDTMHSLGKTASISVHASLPRLTLVPVDAIRILAIKSSTAAKGSRNEPKLLEFCRSEIASMVMRTVVPITGVEQPIVVAHLTGFEVGVQPIVVFDIRIETFVVDVYLEGQIVSRLLYFEKCHVTKELTNISLCGFGTGIPAFTGVDD